MRSMKRTIAAMMAVLMVVTGIDGTTISALAAEQVTESVITADAAIGDESAIAAEGSTGDEAAIAAEASTGEDAGEIEVTGATGETEPGTVSEGDEPGDTDGAEDDTDISDEVEQIPNPEDVSAGDVVPNETVEGEGWELSENEVGLKLTFTADIANYDNTSNRPWHEYRSTVTEVEISSQVTSIGKNAFRDFTALTGVTFEEGAKTIGEAAFYGCKNLSAISIPGSVESFGTGAFRECSKLSYVLFADNIKATTLSESMFEACTSLTAISLPDKITTIGKWTFYGCSKFEGISSGMNHVTTIGEYSFQKCTFLSNIVIPKSVTSIGVGAFKDCTGLLQVVFEKDIAITSIPNELFCNDTQLVTVNTVDSLGKTVGMLPDAVVSIGNYAFSECKVLDKVILPNGVTSIGNSAFSGCKRITEFTFPSGITSLGSYVLRNCEALKSVSFATGYNYKTIPSYTFSGCKLLTSVVIPESVTSIGDRAFETCQSLTSFSIPSNVTSMGNYVFNGCTSLETVSYSSGMSTIREYTFVNCSGLKTVTGIDHVTSIENGAFKSCTSLETFTIPATVTDTTLSRELFDGCTALKSVTIKNKNTAIGDAAFRGCTSLETFTIPAGIISLGASAFENCTALKTVNTVKNSEDAETLKTIGGSCFKNCTELTNFAIPSTVVTITNQAFYGCKKFAALTMPAGLTTLGYNAFYNCEAMTGVITIPAGITKLESGVFYGSGINEITIPTTITNDNIAQETFKNCKNLTKVTIQSNTIKSIYSGAFAGCTSLETIVIPDSVTQIRSGNFEGCTSLKNVTLPTNSEFTKLESKLFKGCTSLETIAIPAQVTVIEGEVFSGCTSLSDVTLPTSADFTYLADNLFRGCTSLKSISIPSNVKELRNYCFLESGIEEFVVPAGITSIGYNILEGSALKKVSFADGFAMTTLTNSMFRNCTSLTDVTIPASVTDLRTGIFDGCSSLAAVKVDAANTVYYSFEGIVMKKATSSGSEDSCAFRPAARPKNVTISEGVTKLPTEAYKGDRDLETITLPKSLTEIAGNSFDGCWALKEINVDSANTVYTSYAGWLLKRADATSVCKPYAWTKPTEIPAGVIALPYGIFSGNGTITEINLPASIEIIASNAFDGCGNLTAVNIAKGCKNYYSEQGIVYKKDGTEFFRPAASNVKPVLKEGVKILTADFYRGNTTVTSVTIPASVEEISPYAFEGCTKLKTVTFKSGSKLKKIGNHAFDGCSALTAISVPAGCEEIGSYTFYNCKKLAKVTFASGSKLKTIEYDAFTGCIVLAEISFPSSVETFGSYIFSNCVKLTKVTLPSGLKTIPEGMFKGCKALTTLTLPSSLEVIKGYAFSGTAIAKITIPASVKELGSGALNGMTKLKSVTFAAGSKLEKIGNTCFEGDTLLTKIVLPDSVTRIGHEAFKGLTKLASFNIPASVTYVDSEAFANTGIRALALPAKNKDGDVIDYQGSVFANCNALKSVVLSEGMTKVPQSMFEGCSALTSISLPKTITEVGNYAFYGCSSVVSLTLPAGVSVLDSSAFCGMSSLEEILIAEDPDVESPVFTSVDGILYTDNNTKLFYMPLNWYSKTGEFSIPEGVKYIEVSFFAYREDLIYVNLPASLERIEENAFDSCTRLKKVTIAADSKLSFIGDSAFYGCEDLYLVEFKQGGPNTARELKIDNYAFSNCSALTQLKMTEDYSNVYIGKYAFEDDTEFVGLLNGNEPVSLGNIFEGGFAGCTSLCEVYIGSKATKIEFDYYRSGDLDVTLYDYSAFSNCKKLRAIHVNADNPYYASKDGVLYSKNMTILYKCPQAASNVTIADTVQTLNEYAFVYNTGIRELQIPASVKTIEEGAFMQTGITHIEVAENSALYTIKTHAFAFDSNLQSVDLENANELEEIQKCAFMKTGNLTDVSFPNFVLYIGQAAFYYSSLVNVTTLPASLTEIEKYCFYNSEIKELTVPKSVTSIEDEAFNNSDLMKLEFEEGSNLKSIGYKAFYYCEMTSVELPEGLTSLDAMAFAYSSLEEIILPSTLTTYGTARFTATSHMLYGISASYLFYGCKSLRRVEFRNDTTPLPKYMFYQAGADAGILTIYGHAGSAAQTYCKNYETNEKHFTQKGIEYTLDNYTTVQFCEIGGDVVPGTVSDNDTGYADDKHTMQYSYTAETGTLVITGVLPAETETIAEEDDEDEYWGYLNASTEFRNKFKAVAKHLVIGENVDEVGGDSFMCFSVLETVTIAENVSCIDYDTFYRCTNLKKVTIEGNNKLYIGNYAFEHCVKLEEIRLSARLTKENFDPEYVFYGCSGLKNIELDERYAEDFVVADGLLCEKVPNADGYSLNVVFVPEGLCGGTCVVGNRVSGFSTSMKFAYIDVVSSNPYLCSVNGVAYTKDMKTLYCVPRYWNLNDGVLEIAEGTETIMAGACAYNNLLKKVVLPESVTTIGSSAFAECMALESINLPSGIRVLPYCTFYFCKNLTSIDLPEGLLSIGEEALAYCYSLESIKLPDSLVMLDKYAFRACGRITSIEIPAGVKELPYGAFYSCSQLGKVTLPEGLTSIGVSAFSYCTSLKDIYIPLSVTTIATEKVRYTETISTPFDNLSSSFTIYGVEGSDAEDFCANYDFTFVAANRFTITYKLDRTQNEYNNVDNPTIFRDTDSVITLLDAEKMDGDRQYFFDGWYLDEEFTQPITKIVPSTAHNYVLYPKFVKPVTVYFYNYYDDEVVFSVTVKEGTAIGEAIRKTGFPEINPDLAYIDKTSLTAYPDNYQIKEDMYLYVILQYMPYGIVASPVASLVNGEYPENTLIYLTCETPNVSIYYSFTTDFEQAFDPEDPEVEVYTEPIALEWMGDDGTSLYVIAVKTLAVPPEGDSETDEESQILSNPVSYFYTVVKETAGWGDVRISDRKGYETPEDLPEGIWVAGVPESVEYDGKAQSFEVRVYDNNKLLTEKVDYTVKFSNNKVVADVTAKKAPAVTVTGKGDYTGSVTKKFAITPVDINSAEVYYKAYVNYTGKAIKQTPTLVLENGVKLKNKTDFTISYPSANYKNPGTVKLVITGKKNATGSIELEYEIQKKIPLSKVKITGFEKSINIADAESHKVSIYYYLMPDGTIQMGYYSFGSSSSIGQVKMELSYQASKNSEKEVLVKGQDYYVIYENADKIGTAKVTIVADPDSDYCGSVTKTYKIVGTSIKKAKVTGWASKLTYTGDAILQKNLTVTLNVGTKKKPNVKTLVKGVDYKVTYKKNIAAGTATATFTGIGVYTGSFTKKFTITTYSLSTDSNLRKPLIDISVGPEAVYTKGTTLADITVTFRGRELVRNKDYKVAYKNNTKVCDADAAKAPQVTITLKGSLKGSQTVKFSIVNSSLDNATITCASTLWKDIDGNYAAKPVITDSNGKKLEAGKDYSTSYEYTYAETVVLENEGRIIRRVGCIVDETDRVPSGTMMKVTVMGAGCYAGGTLTTTYKVVKGSVAGAKISLTAGTTYIYSGKMNTPKKSELVVKVGGITLEPSDYEIVSCESNIRKGTAVLTIRGVGSYGDTVTFKFPIAAKKF